MPLSSPRVIILGGGVIGALSAYEAAKTGCEVILVERRSFGGGASGTSAAMLELQVDAHRGEPFLSLARASNSLFEPLYDELRELTGVDFQLERCGILQLSMSDDDEEALKLDVARQRELGLDAEWMDADSLAERVPQLNQERGGALFRDDGQVNGEKLLLAALEGARKKGAQLVEEAGDTSFKIGSDGRPLVSWGREQVRADHLVLAAGAWTDDLLAPHQRRLGIEPVRGQLLVYDAPRSVLPFPVYTNRGKYLTPKQDGYLFAGTTVERAGFDETPTSEAREHIRELAQGLLPLLSRHAIRGATAGLRPRSPTELPILGCFPDWPRVFVAAGHYRNGILLAPITAKIVACHVQGIAAPIDLKPYAPTALKTQPTA